MTSASPTLLCSHCLYPGLAAPVLKRCINGIIQCLAYLREFHIDILKIDQSFIRMIGSDALSGHIVDNVIDLAKRLQMVTVAEGVETPEQAEHLKQYNLDFLQGYLFGRPEDLKIFSDKWLL